MNITKLAKPGKCTFLISRSRAHPVADLPCGATARWIVDDQDVCTRHKQLLERRAAKRDMTAALYSGRDDGFVLDVIRRRVDTEYATVKHNVQSELRRMRDAATRGITAIEAGDRLDAYLVTNIEQLTAHVAKWNLLRDLVAMLTQTKNSNSEVSGEGQKRRTKDPRHDHHDHHDPADFDCPHCEHR